MRVAIPILHVVLDLARETASVWLSRWLESGADAARRLDCYSRQPTMEARSPKCRSPNDHAHSPAGIVEHDVSSVRAFLIVDHPHPHRTTQPPRKVCTSWRSSLERLRGECPALWPPPLGSPPPLSVPKKKRSKKPNSEATEETTTASAAPMQDKADAGKGAAKDVTANAAAQKMTRENSETAEQQGAPGAGGLAGSGTTLVAKRLKVLNKKLVSHGQPKMADQPL